MESIVCSTPSGGLDNRPAAGALTRRGLAGLALGAVAARGAFAQSFPNRPLRWVVPWPPGGSTDAIARLLAQEVSQELGTPIVIDNRAGAGGMIGSDAVAKAAPDGYTALVSDGALATASSLYRSLPFDPLTDLHPVALAVTLPHAIVVKADSPARDLAGFIAMAKARPGAVDFGSGGVGSPLHLAGELFRTTAGITWNHVPYRGAGPAVTAVLSGEVQVAVPSLPAAIALLRDGSLRALAVTANRRVSVLPDVPTVAEAGLPDAAMAGWVGLHLPARAPEEAVRLLEAAVMKAVEAPALRARLLEQGGDIAIADAAGYGEMLKAESARWSRIIAAAGIKPE